MTCRWPRVPLTCLLACLLSAGVSPAQASETPPPTTSSQPSPVARKLDQAQLAFQRDLVSVLAPGADAQTLLGAALLARPLAHQPPSNSFHALIERAAAAPDAGAAVSWVQLADCDAQADACPNPQALQRLLTQAPDNAAVWLLKLGVDARNLKTDEAREDLAQAAAATLYNDYTGSSLKALAKSVGTLPPPAGSFDPTRAAGALGMQLVMVYGIANAQPQPSLPLISHLCENAGDDASITDDCLKLAKLLEWGSSPLARSLGLHLREVLSDDPAQQRDAADARRELIWQVHRFGQLLAAARDDAAVARQLLALARHGGTQMSLQLAALRANDIPTDAPADWQPTRTP